METKTTKYLRHDFTEEEMKEMHSNLAEKTVQLRRKEEEKSTVLKQFGASIEALKNEISSTADKLHTKYEFRMMECVIDYFWDKGVKKAIHTETLDYVNEEPITDDDRQEKLELEEKNN